MKLQDLLNALPFAAEVDRGLEISGIAIDHRKVEEGSMFVCIQGHTVDGHIFAEEAARKGAAAVVSQKPLELDIPVIRVRDTKKALPILADTYYGHPTSGLHLIGITGTNGKTTTSYMLEEIFRQAGQKTGLIGTIGMKIGERVLETKNTTPDNLVLQETFARMKEENVTTAVMEVSSHALIQGRVDGLDFDVAVFTNLSQDHLDYHKTMEEYRRAKGLLFTRLGNTYAEPKYAVLNADDAASRLYMEETAARIVTYGIDSEADFFAENIQMDRNKTTFTLRTPDETRAVTLGMMGKFSVYNALAAISAAWVSGVSLTDIMTTLEGMPGVPGRFEAVNAGQDFTVIVDYAHTPDSLENVLKTIRQFAKKRVFAVVGCGGDRDRTKRPLMAQAACEYATDPIFTADNPRTEDPEAILEDMEAGVRGRTYQVIPDRKQAITAAVETAGEGDVILIAGKGHETYQIIGDKVHDFDDRLVARNAIKELK